MNWVVALVLIILTVILIIPSTITVSTFAVKMKQLHTSEVHSRAFLLSAESLGECRARFDALRKTAIRKLCSTFTVLLLAYFACMGIIFLISWLISLIFA